MKKNYICSIRNSIIDTNKTIFEIYLFTFKKKLKHFFRKNNIQIRINIYYNFFPFITIIIET